ncbi:hypothetical protein M9458_047207, partial [Cirrhinus mrigala]
QPTKNRLDMQYLQSVHQTAAPQRPTSFFPEVHEVILQSWRSPYLAQAQAMELHMLLGYTKPPPMEEAVASHLCPSARGWKSARSIPSKQYRTTDHIADKAYMAADQATKFTIHTMVVFQAFQAKMLQTLDEEGPDSAAFKRLRLATDLMLRAMKKMAHGNWPLYGQSHHTAAASFADVREGSAIEHAHILLCLFGPETVKGDEPFPAEERLFCCTSATFQILFAAFKKVQKTAAYSFLGSEGGHGASRETKSEEFLVPEENGTPSF